MKTCDIIIPIYNSPEWVKMCVYALYKNTPKEYIGKVILMNDNSDELTCNCIENLRNKYKNIEVYKNESNVGFIKNVNRGMDKTTAEYILLLNTDCLLSNNTIPKLIEHMEKNKKIGLICPISSNAANLSFDIPENYSYVQINDMFYDQFKGMNFDACTVVGNCLMISRECMKETGYLDEIYGMGYGDETDYQFKAHSKGFEAKVAIDTYVYHKSEVSFGTSPEKQKRLDHNRKIFFDRWGDEYNKKMELYVKNDPIEYIKSNLKIIKKPSPEVLFYLPDIHQNAGGVHVVVDIVNYLNINGIFANILTERVHEYKEIMIFTPSYLKNINDLRPKCIVGTIYPSIFYTETIAKHYNIPAVNFMQGYEPCFDNGDVYGWAELACKNSQNILAISNFLKKKCKENFNRNADVIPNSINIDLLYNRNKVQSKKKTITMVFRNSFPKGDFILIEILKQLTLCEKNIDINVIHMKDIMFPVNNSKNVNINFFKGPLNRKDISNILFRSDIFVDASILEGFGLMSLEAMAAGAVPVLSESFGVDEYARDGINSFVIKEVNNADKYVEKIKELLNDNSLLKQMSQKAQEETLKFDIDKNINKYINYFSKVEIKEKQLTDEELNELKKWIIPENELFSKKQVIMGNVSKKRKLYYKFLGLFPKKLKTKIKGILAKLIQG
ncbi:MAG: glycosyltransferase [Clostridia bacterium]|nr:glycosyltransferase [Clostridia bacterium]